MKTHYPRSRSSLSPLRRISTTGTALSLALGTALTGCSTTPPPVPPPEPPPVQKPLAFAGLGSSPIPDRANATPQEIVNNANLVWTSRRTDAASYLQSSRLMSAVLGANSFTSAEEEMRLSTMTIQHAILANDVETLRLAVQHWEAGYRGIRQAPIAGEIESYLIALRRLGRELPDELLNVANPEIQTLLKSES